MMVVAIAAVAVLLLIYGAYGLLILRGLRPPRQTPGRSERPMVSVVVAARNEAACIGDLLEDLCHQSWPAEKLEIIVVDDGSTDATAATVEEFADRGAQLLRLTSCPPGWSPKKHALERAIELATGEIIATTDADCRVGSRWIEGLVAAYDDDTGLVAGFSRIDPEATGRSWVAAWEGLDFLALLSAAAGTLNQGLPMSVTGQNLSYRRSAFYEVGGFTAVRHRPSGDDMLLMQLISGRTSWRCRFNLGPDSFVTTRACTRLRDLLSQRARWASNASARGFVPAAFLLYLVVAWLAAVGQVALLLGSAAAPALLPATALLWSGKLLLDRWVIGQGAARFEAPDLLRFFPLWALTVPFYTLLMGAIGPFGRFRWKGRLFSAAVGRMTLPDSAN